MWGGVGHGKILILFKFGFVGQGHCMPSKLGGTPPKNFLKKVLWNLKNFQKGIFENAF